MDKNETALSLQEISTLTAKDLPFSSRIAIFPIGSNEQHGPHLPMGTDSIILDAVVRGVRQRLSPKDPFIFLPLMPYGKSPEHMDFSGTISFKATTLLAVLEDIVSSLHKHGVKRIVFLNSHGGNNSLLDAVAYDLRYEYKVLVHCLNIWSDEIISPEAIETIIPGLDYPEVHAASIETSLLMYLNPELVGPIPQEFNPKTQFPSIPTGWATTDLSYDGVIGDPRKSSSQRGKLLYELLVEKTIDKLKTLSQSQ
ncbi:MAG: creatininase family protein [Bellilinea sp.]